MRRDEMNTLAISLGIVPSQYKNKQTLWNEIQRKQKEPPSVRCYNQTDPCTLDPIDEIPDLVEWTMTIRDKEYRFAASQQTLCKLLETQDKPVLLPWTIDFCSGVEASSNVDWYHQTFDLRRLKDTLCPHNVDPPYNPHDEPSQESTINAFLFGIDALVDNPYLYGILLNRIVRANRRQIYERVYQGMTRVLFMLQDNPLQFDIFYNYCYLVYTTTSFHLNKEDHLRLLLDTLRYYAYVAGPFSQMVINLLFTEI